MWGSQQQQQQRIQRGAAHPPNTSFKTEKHPLRPQSNSGCRPAENLTLGIVQCSKDTGTPRWTQEHPVFCYVFHLFNLPHTQDFRSTITQGETFYVEYFEAPTVVSQVFFSICLPVSMGCSFIPYIQARRQASTRWLGSQR